MIRVNKCMHCHEIRIRTKVWDAGGPGSRLCKKCRTRDRGKEQKAHLEHFISILGKNAFFWSKVDKTGGPRACWLWKNASSSQGYGRVKVGGKLYSPHRLVCEWKHGPPPQENLDVLHECDNPRCVNPQHLSWGTRSQNMRDCVKRGRYVVGLKPNQRLDAEKAIVIKTLYRSGEYTQKQIGTMYGVTEDAISKVTRGLARYAEDTGEEISA